MEKRKTVPDKSKRMSGTQSVDRALSLLIALSEDENYVSVTDLARRVDLHPATAHRLLKSLVASGFAAQDSTTSRYHLGLRLLQIANRYRQKRELSEFALPALERLTADTGETTGLISRDGMNTVVIARVMSPLPLLFHTSVGVHGPLHATAAGKVLLSYMAEADLEQVLATPLTAFTERTVTNPTILREELDIIRKQGYAIAVDDYHESVTTVAAPIFESPNHVVAAVSVPGPSSRIRGERLDTVRDKVIQTARMLCSMLGMPSEE